MWYRGPDKIKKSQMNLENEKKTDKGNDHTHGNATASTNSKTTATTKYYYYNNYYYDMMWKMQKRSSSFGVMCKSSRNFASAHEAARNWCTQLCHIFIVRVWKGTVLLY